MKFSVFFAAATLILLAGVSSGIAQEAKDSASTPPQTPEQIQRGPAGRFVDADGDGFNDLAPDADEDGIPNGRDADFAGPRRGFRGGKGAQRFVDTDGDGFNDNAPDHDGDGIINCQDEDFTGPAGRGWGGGRRGNRRGR